MIDSCPINHTIETDVGQPTAVVVWEAPNATDNSKEAVSVSCLPTSGSNFTIGQTEVVCKAEDRSGNIATCRFDVNVTGMYIYHTDTSGPYTSQFLVVGNMGVHYHHTISSQNKDDVCLVCVGATLIPHDMTEKNFVYFLSHNHTDKEQPVINTCPINQTRETDVGQPTAVVVWEAPNATDNSKGAVSVSCSPTTGSNFTIGQTEVVCKAEDGIGNMATCRFDVNVTGMCCHSEVNT